MAVLISLPSICFSACWAKLAGMAKKYALDGGTKTFNRILKGLVEGVRRYAMAPYGEVGWVQNVRAAGGRARVKSRGREEAVRLQAIMPGEAAPLLKKYMESFSRVQPYFEAKPGDPVERFAAEADKHPVFEILPG
jgi:hypothetical protein